MRPKRTDDKYWTGTRDFNHIQYESDLEDYIIVLENETQKLRIGAVMHLLYQELSKEYKVPVERIMLAITDDAKFFQAYSTNEMEVDLFYLCDVTIPNGA